MPRFSKPFLTAVFALTPVLTYASSQDTKGAIVGSADSGAQIVVTGVDTGAVIGVVAKCDGSYRADGLAPGRYSIVEGGPHHATRKLEVSAGKEAHVDLGAATTESTQACEAKRK
jgi:hypothetical protein